MATVYSLICWGGRTGKTVTLTDAGDIVNSANHGLRDGTPVQFASGTLPSGLALNTTYYAKSTGTGTFTLYTTSALTTQVTWTGAGTGPFVLKSKAVIDYMAAYPTRWGEVGSERIYGGYASARAGQVSNASSSSVVFFEVGEAFSDFIDNGTRMGIDLVPNLVISTTVNGIRSPGFHRGVVGYGYEMLVYITDFYPNVTLDGITIRPQSVAQNTTIFTIGTLNVIITNCIFYGYNILNCSFLILQGYANGCLIANNVFLLASIGIQNYGASYSVIGGNICSKCTTGFSNSGNAALYRLGLWINNISVGNTTNWGTKPTSLQVATNNFGELNDIVWTAGAGTYGTMTTSDFKNWAVNDLRPALVDSPQVDAGIAYYGAPGTDIADAEVPNYNNGGAEAVDVGCYEFDHGYGPRPASTTVTFSGVNAGSEIRVYDASGNELAGVESSSANPSLTWTVAVGEQRIVIVHLEYKIKDFAYSNVAGNIIIPVQQERDTWFSNP